MIYPWEQAPALLPSLVTPWASLGLPACLALLALRLTCLHDAWLLSACMPSRRPACLPGLPARLTCLPSCMACMPACLPAWPVCLPACLHAWSTLGFSWTCPEGSLGALLGLSWDPPGALLGALLGLSWACPGSPPPCGSLGAILGLAWGSLDSGNAII